MCNISCQISKEDKPLPTNVGDGALLFEMVAVNISDLCNFCDTVLAYTDPSAVSISLYNDPNEYYFLKANTQLVQIEHFMHEIPMYEMEMNSLNREIYKINNIKLLF
jgi:hypothetical protein